MPRKVRNAVILAKIEDTPYTDSEPTGADNAIQIASLDVNPYVSRNVDRNLIRRYFGRSGQLVGPGYVEMSFEVELQGSGTAGTAPAWGPLMRAGAFEEGIEPGEFVEYVPRTDELESLTIYYHRDGVKHAAVGCQGTFEFAMGVGERPTLKCRFLGKSSVPTATADPSPVLTAWKVPAVISDANTADLVIGGTYADGVISGGTTFVSAGISINMANGVEFIPLVGAEYVDVTDRQPVGQLTLDLSASQEVTFDGYVRNNTLVSVGMVHGTTAGHKVLIFAPKVQLMNRRHVDVSGLLMNQFDLGFDPDSGDDELRVVVL